MVNPRWLCLKMLKRWDNGGVFADDVLHENLATADLSPADRGFLTELFYGVLRNRRLLDFAINRFATEKVDLQAARLLQIGLYQILFLRTPSHAAVHETVAVANIIAEELSGFINAILRSALRDLDALEAAIAAASLAIRTSHPPFLIERWEKQIGPEATAALCHWNNTPAPIYVRANLLKPGALDEISASPSTTPFPGHPHLFKVQGIPHAWLDAGLGYVQDPSTLLACDLLAPIPGQAILDACAAPGGKTAYLAQLMDNKGTIVACDRESARLPRLDENLQRLGVKNTVSLHLDWRWPGEKFTPASFDRILVDAPCTNTGVMRRRVDVRWRIFPQDFPAMARRQLAILESVVPYLKPGGALVYSTCSIDPQENQSVVDHLLKYQPTLSLDRTVASYPFRDDCDGAFAARFLLASA